VGFVFGGGEQFQGAQLEAHGHPIGGLEHDAGLEGGAPPLRAVPVEVPGALHLQMRVDARLPHVSHQVLAAAEHLVHYLTGEVDGGEGRHPHIAAGERGTVQSLVETACAAVDGVALRH
jgi:hypothetical protein